MKQVTKRIGSNFCVLAIFVFLTGCASTPQGLKDDQEAKRAFVVPENYQLVLKRIVEQNQECRAQPLLPIGQVIFDVQHYPDLKEATISSGASGFGTQIYEVINIQGLPNGGASVTTWSKIRTDEFSRRIAKIAAGEKGC